MPYQIDNEVKEWFVFARLKYIQLNEMHEAFTNDREYEPTDEIIEGWDKIFNGLGEATLNFMTSCLVEACGKSVADKIDLAAFPGATIEQSIGDYLSELCEDILSMSDIPVLSIVEEFELWLGELESNYGENE